MFYISDVKDFIETDPTLEVWYNIVVSRAMSHAAPGGRILDTAIERIFELVGDTKLPNQFRQFLKARQVGVRS